MDFKNAGALETHIKARHPDIRQNRVPAQVKKATREKFTLEQKIRALEMFYDCASDDRVLFPYQDTAKRFFGVAWQARRSYIGKWLKQADKFSDAVADLRAMKCRTDERARIGRVRKADFPEEEDELYRCFIERRLVHGYPVNYGLLASAEVCCYPGEFTTTRLGQCQVFMGMGCEVLCALQTQHAAFEQHQVHRP